MGNRFYEEGGGRARRVGELFDLIARRYDLVNDLQSGFLHRRWKRRLAGLAAPAPGPGRALDVCCGTGDVALELRSRGRSVVGLDFNDAMLAVAAPRLAARGAGDVLLVKGDALRLPFPDRSFDAVTVAYGLRNLADLDLGLAELWRVTGPGGRLAALELGMVGGAVAGALFRAYLSLVVPALGWLFFGDRQAYGYLLASLERYPGARAVAERLRGMGATSVDVVELWGGGMTLVSAERGASA